MAQLSTSVPRSRRYPIDYSRGLGCLQRDQQDKHGPTRQRSGQRQLGNQGQKLPRQSNLIIFAPPDKEFVSSDNHESRNDDDCWEDETAAKRKCLLGLS